MYIYCEITNPDVMEYIATQRISFKSTIHFSIPQQCHLSHVTEWGRSGKRLTEAQITKKSLALGVISVCHKSHFVRLTSAHSIFTVIFSTYASLREKEAEKKKGGRIFQHFWLHKSNFIRPRVICATRLCLTAFSYSSQTALGRNGLFS